MTCAAITTSGMSPSQAFDIMQGETKLDLGAFSTFITNKLGPLWPADKKWDKESLHRLFRYMDLNADGEIAKDEFVVGATTVEGAEFQRVQYYCLNPKSIKSGQLSTVTLMKTVTSGPMAS